MSQKTPQRSRQTSRTPRLHIVDQNTTGMVILVLDLRISNDRFGSSSDPSLNGHLHYPNDIDKSLNETVTDKIRKYRVDYNNKPPRAVSFIPTIVSTSGRLHSELLCFSYRLIGKLTVFCSFRSSASTNRPWTFQLQFLVFHLTGAHIQVLSLPLVLLIHNKLIVNQTGLDFGTDTLYRYYLYLSF